MVPQPPGQRPATEIDAAQVNAALAAWRGGDRATARRSLEAVLARSPRDAQVLSLLGRLCLELKDTRAAIAHLDRFVAVKPDQPEAWLTLASLVDDQSGPAAAAQRLHAGLAALPGDIGIRTNLGVLLGKAGDFAAARVELEAALALDANPAPVHFNLARLLKQTGDAAGALTHYRRAVEINPDFTQAQHNLGNLLLDLDRAAEAVETFRIAARLRLAARPEHEPRLFAKTSAIKLRHDIEQLRHLRAQGLLDARHDRTIADYQSALMALPKPAPGETMVDIPAAFRAKLAPTYNRLLHWDEGAALAGPAISPAVDFAAVESMYRENAPGIAWFDGLLTAEALAALRRFCLNSTIWNEFRYSNGYLGAFLDRGFACPLLHQIARELAAAMPAIFAGHPIAKMWAFKYDSQPQVKGVGGIPIHADFAAVNVNFWITPDESNLDPEGGGLGVWDKEAPLDWDFAAYNKNEPAIRRFLKESGAKMINVPHRQNRAVMFNSDLFHETGTLTFKDGYENRRINVTMLFGRRETSRA